MMLGNDVSVFQGAIDYDTYKKNANFVIVKASEGVGFTDKQFARSQSEARRVGLPIGYYHFARPDLGNDPAVEADWFLKVVGAPVEGEMLCLDFEVSCADPVGWCKKFLDRIAFMRDGYRPLIYMDQSRTSGFNWKPVVDSGYGLWLASYTYDPNVNTGKIGAWPFMAMQQWTSSQVVPGIIGNVDGNVLFGDLATFRAYGYKKPVVAPTPPTVPPAPPEAPIPPTPPVSTPPTTPPSGGDGSGTVPTVPETPPAPQDDLHTAALTQINVMVNHSSWWTYLAGRNKMREILKAVGFI